MSIANGGLYASIIGYGLLLSLLLISGQRSRHGALAIVATAATVLWSLNGVFSGPSGFSAVTLSGLDETFRIFAWAAIPWLLLNPNTRNYKSRFLLFVCSTALIQILLIVVIVGLVVLPGTWVVVVIGQIVPCALLFSSLVSLALVERVFRIADSEHKRTVSLLSVCLGLMFAADFLAFTDRLLFERVNLELMQARGFLFALLSIPLAVALARTPSRTMELHVSRDVVTGSAALLFAGIYLLLVAATGYFIRTTQFAAAGVLEIVFGFTAIVLLVALVSSRSLRSRLRVVLSKHLFSYKYDYRNEWLSFTRKLTDDASDTPSAIINGISSIVQSETGVLWARGASGQLELSGELNVVGYNAVTAEELASLQRFLVDTRWLVDLDEYRRDNARYEGLDLTPTISRIATAWLIVPLPFRDDIIGCVLVGRSRLIRKIDWEDRDLLKSAGHQAAGLLALHLANQQLSEARQFEAFNRTSAYVMHDLKNILGQQSLIVANSAKHKHKPAFVDDVVATIENSVERMRSLLEQLSGHDESSKREVVRVGELVESVVDSRRHFKPVPSLVVESSDMQVLADHSRLTRVVAHLVQNAQEASAVGDEIVVTTRRANDGQAVIEVRDTGSGMSEDFMREQLFRPFKSTKGLTGMGIGAYEVQQYLREIGGTVRVSSTPGVGTNFILQMPLAGDR